MVVATTKESSVVNRSHRTATHCQVIDDANRTLTFVPASFICLRIWGTLRFIIDTCDQDQNLGAWTAIFVPLQVGGNILVSIMKLIYQVSLSLFSGSCSTYYIIGISCV